MKDVIKRAPELITKFKKAYDDEKTERDKIQTNYTKTTSQIDILTA